MINGNVNRLPVDYVEHLMIYLFCYLTECVIDRVFYVWSTRKVENDCEAVW